MNICLILPLPAGSSDLPESTTGRRIALYSVLLRMGFTSAPSVTRKAVSSYLTVPPLPQENPVAVYFCCTSLGVSSTGRYPAPCPAKPGLSSPAAFRQLQPRSPVLLASIYYIIFFLKRKNFFTSLHLLQKLRVHRIAHSEDVHHVLSPR